MVLLPLRRRALVERPHQGLNDRNRVARSDGLRRNAVMEGRRRAMGVRRAGLVGALSGQGRRGKGRRAEVDFASAGRAGVALGYGAQAVREGGHHVAAGVGVAIVQLPRLAPVERIEPVGVARGDARKVTLRGRSGLVVVVDQGRVKIRGEPVDAGLESLVGRIDRKSTRLNSSHEWISYAFF